MPAKNTLKLYLENSYYHIYNRGVEKRQIFQDDQDYAVFLSYLKTYLSPRDEAKLRLSLADKSLTYKERVQLLKYLQLNNFADEITLLAYCLMPNHFHFLIKQKSKIAINRFMRSIGTRYTMFFNKKNNRVGPLYQTAYKAKLVTSEEQLLYLTSYIHRNPLSKDSKTATKGDSFLINELFSQPSSLPEYLGKRNTEWLHFEEILDYFSATNPSFSYQSFVGQQKDFSKVSNLALDF